MISKCLQKDREARDRNAAEIRGRLERLRRKQERLRPLRVAMSKRVALPIAAVLCLATVAYLRMLPLPPPRVSGYVRISDDGRAKGGAAGRHGGRPQWVTALFGGSVRVASAVAQIPAGGGETTLVATPFALPEIQGMSPSRSELLLTSFDHGVGWPLWILPIPSGKPRAWETCWPPARMVARWPGDCLRQGSKLYRANGDGSEIKSIATLPGTAFWLRWSPDGSRLRMTIGNVVDKTGMLAIWEVAADGTGLHPLLPGWNKPPTACCGNWTSDGKYFVFQATRSGKTEIWALREPRGVRAGLLAEPMNQYRLLQGN